jgi:hypothetical protein
MSWLGQRTRSSEPAINVDFKNLWSVTVGAQSLWAAAATGTCRC